MFSTVKYVIHLLGSSPGGGGGAVKPFVVSMRDQKNPQTPPKQVFSLSSKVPLNPLMQNVHKTWTL